MVGVPANLKPLSGVAPAVTPATPAPSVPVSHTSKPSTHTHSVSPKHDVPVSSHIPLKGKSQSVMELQENILQFTKNIGVMKQINFQFGEFLIKNYMENSFSKDHQLFKYLKQDVLNKNIAPVNFNDIIDTLHRIGTTSNVRLTDGIWGARTQNALKLIIAFGEAMAKFSQDVGKQLLNSKGKPTNLLAVVEKAKQDLPKESDPKHEGYPLFHSAEEQDAKATEFVGFVSIINSAFLSFDKNILQDPNIKNYVIEQKEPLFKQKAYNVLSQQAVVNMMSAGVPGIDVHGMPITIRDLASPQNFLQFIHQDESIGQEAIPKILMDLRNQIAQQLKKKEAPREVQNERTL